jgi:molybdopterin-containing oxidoreductase family iron-sulfur binding subunit
MHWIRIDSYFTFSGSDLSITNLPVPCMQCENAPCEYVCPTGATSHSEEGLNQMTYNRCVGTRYCSNNCPYKVRRFNFLAFAASDTNPETALQRNPEVTVRTNGVMEKCTYCVQRLQRTRIQIERNVVDHEEAAKRAANNAEADMILAEGATQRRQLLESLQTACQQSCPTRAIVFGDIQQRASQIVSDKAEPHDYSLLAELNTKPRTTYLARITNPNPGWPKGES